jgi:hypothetical protein
MAQKVTVTLEDDLTGGPAEQTVRFAFEGTDYEIVLRISEIPRCRSLEFPRGRAVRRAWDELTGLSSPVLLAG